MSDERLSVLERRVAALEAREQILALVTRYAVACDTHDMPTLGSLFAEDAEFDSPSGVMVAKGRDGILSMFAELFRIRGPAYHWTHDVIVDVDKSDSSQATGVVYSHAETTPNGVVSLAAMRYQDVYRQEGGRWLFSRRCISFLYYVPAMEYLSGLNQSRRLVFGDQRLPADYPERLQSWQDFEDRGFRIVE